MTETTTGNSQTKPQTMTIAEAIKRLSFFRAHTKNLQMPDLTLALGLGSEALTVIGLAREGNYTALKRPLPGETKE